MTSSIAFATMLLTRAESVGMNRIRGPNHRHDTSQARWGWACCHDEPRVGWRPAAFERVFKCQDEVELIKVLHDKTHAGGHAVARMRPHAIWRACAILCAGESNGGS
jgi:hypothetical protein